MADIDKLVTVSDQQRMFWPIFGHLLCCHSIAGVPVSSQPALDNQCLRRGGWGTIPFVLLNELVERLAAVGLLLNLISYLMDSYHMSQVMAASIISFVHGTSSFTPLVGAFVSDAYIGRFWTILLGSIFHLIASLFLVATAACKSLRPSPGRGSASQGQLAFLLVALGFTTVAAGALRPCSYAFGTDQLVSEQDTADYNKRKTQSFFNWYFFFLHCALLGGATILVYVQDTLGWVWGFSVPAACVLISTPILLLGVPWYHFVPPSGSPFTVYARVIVAAVRKAKHSLPMDSQNLYGGKFIPFTDPGGIQESLPHTSRLKWLDHASIVTKTDLNQDGSVSSSGTFYLCSIHEVEQLKSVVALAPVWMVNLLSTTVLSQHGSFNVPQARRMERHIGFSGFTIPPASMSVFSFLTFVLWIPFYDRVVVPRVRKITGHPGGATTLQRIGVGFSLSVAALMVSGLVEMKRRRLALQNESLSAMWLVPQHFLYGMAESFHSVGQLEFLYDQLPGNTRSVAGAVFWCSAGFGQYAGIIILQVVHHVTAAAGSDWLIDDLNHGHLDYFFFLLAVLQTVNLVLFCIVSHLFKYKDLKTVQVRSQQD